MSAAEVLASHPQGELETLPRAVRTVSLEREILTSDLRWDYGVAWIKQNPWRLPGILFRGLGNTSRDNQAWDLGEVLGPEDVSIDEKRVEELRAQLLKEEVGVEIVTALPMDWAQRLVEHLDFPLESLRAEQGSYVPPPGRGWLSTLRAIPKALRIHQWPKNGLVFVPLIAAHEFGDGYAWFASCVAALSFAVVSSAVYVLNDVLDVTHDRRHPIKRQRPFASGKLSLAAGCLMIPALLGLAVSLSSVLPSGVGVILSCYFFANVLYSFGLKKFHSLDLVLLAAMYTARLLAGGQASEVVVSPWLVAFSVFFFFGLAAAKRYSDMVLAPQDERQGRGYVASDQPVVLVLGAAGSLLSTLVLALYLNSANVTELYGRPEILWLFLPVLVFWISRIWISASRGLVASDPLLFVLTDRQSHVAAAVALFLFWLAI